MAEFPEVHDRMVENPGRVELLPVVGSNNIYDVIAKPGEILDEGTKIDAYLFNDIKEYIDENGGGSSTAPICPCSVNRIKQISGTFYQFDLKSEWFDDMPETGTLEQIGIVLSFLFLSDYDINNFPITLMQFAINNLAIPKFIGYANPRGTIKPGDIVYLTYDYPTKSSVNPTWFVKRVKSLLSTETQYGMVRVDNDTIKFDTAGNIYSIGSGGGGNVTQTNIFKTTTDTGDDEIDITTTETFEEYTYIEIIFWCMNDKSEDGEPMSEAVRKPMLISPFGGMDSNIVLDLVHYPNDTEGLAGMTRAAYTWSLHIDQNYGELQLYPYAGFETRFSANSPSMPSSGIMSEQEVVNQTKIREINLIKIG